MLYFCFLVWNVLRLGGVGRRDRFIFFDDMWTEAHCHDLHTVQSAFGMILQSPLTFILKLRVSWQSCLSDSRVTLKCPSTVPAASLAESSPHVSWLLLCATGGPSGLGSTPPAWVRVCLTDGNSVLQSLGLSWNRSIFTSHQSYKRVSLGV